MCYSSNRNRKLIYCLSYTRDDSPVLGEPPEASMASLEEEAFSAHSSASNPWLRDGHAA